ncbi:hypothetical protein EZV62_027876 [Acer yangbiense]|uniref:CBS domain-containing protein n=1 Tax=Acer yangbiense TaxID=1000413 RepID=A0A5C7GQ14_9ROSI|nr:hypothetical protein EZV62_027876 [Acer yangbiense]
MFSVTCPKTGVKAMDRRDRYLGIKDYAAIILWVLESAELAAVALSDSSATDHQWSLMSYRWAPFLPVATDSSMLTVLLVLSKYRLRNVPVIEPGNPDMKNFITQSAVIQGLEGCKGRDWFDCIAARPISDLGLSCLIIFQQLTVGDFMNTVVSTTPDSGRVMPPITCRMESTLGSVIHSLASKSVHMIYVVADHKEDEVVGVITLRDVISLASYTSPLTI